jgi:ABC-2 type transport system permease protein
MKELLVLTKAGLINNFNLHSLNYKNYKNKKDALKILLYLFIIVSLMPAYVLYINFLKQLGFSLMMINQELYFSTLAHYASSMMVFFFGLLHVLSYYYFSRDTDMLIPLPLKSRNIVISKFIILLAYEYIILGAFFIPVLVINKSFVGGGLLYVVKAIFTFILTPLVPLTLASILIILLMRYTNIKGKKDLIRVISMFVFLFIMLGIQIVIQRSMINVPIGGEQEFLANLFSDNKLLIDMVGRFFPISKWTAVILAENSLESFTYIFSTLLVNLSAFIAMIFCSERLYLGGIIGGKEANSKKKALSSDQLISTSKKHYPSFISIFKVDMIMLIKTPIYLFNCVSIILIIPFIFLVMPALSGMSSDINVLYELYRSNIKIFEFGLAGAYMFFAAMNPTAPSSFSREGATFWISRIIPAKPWEHIAGKSLSPLALQIATIVIVSVGIKFYIPIKLSSFIISSMLGILGSLPIILAGLFIDISKPLLNWDNPQRAVKQNFNVLISMAIGALITVALGFLTYLMIKAGFSSIIILGLDVLLILGLSVLFYVILKKKIEKQFLVIE